MRNLQLGPCDLFRSLKLKIGHHHPLKVKLDSFKVMYPALCYIKNVKIRSY